MIRFYEKTNLVQHFYDHTSLLVFFLLTWSAVVVGLLHVALSSNKQSTVSLEFLHLAVSALLLPLLLLLLLLLLSVWSRQAASRFTMFRSNCELSRICNDPHIYKDIKMQISHLETTKREAKNSKKHLHVCRFCFLNGSLVICARCWLLAQALIQLTDPDTHSFDFALQPWLLGFLCHDLLFEIGFRGLELFDTLY